MNKSTRTMKILRDKAKQICYHSLLKESQIDMKYTWQLMKEITGKSKLNSNRFPKSINVNGKTIKENSHIAGELNKYFTNVGPNLVSKIQNTSKRFEDFLFPVGKNMEHTSEEFQKKFKSVKYNKAAGYDDIDSNVIIKVYDEITYPILMIFHSSFSEDFSPEQLKLAEVSPIFKVSNTEEVGN